jgi:hypothetical protein
LAPKGTGPDPKLAFVHVHYDPAGAMRYGSEAKVGYEFEGKLRRTLRPCSRHGHVHRVPRAARHG